MTSMDSIISAKKIDSKHVQVQIGVFKFDMEMLCAEILQNELNRELGIDIKKVPEAHINVTITKR